MLATVTRNRGVAALMLGGLFVALLVWLGSDLLRSAYVNFLALVYGEQRAFHNSLVGAVRAHAREASWTTGWAIVASSFLYGVFHAAGPGHGKVVVSAYLLSQPKQLKRSVGLAVAASLVQGLVAVTLIYGLFLAFGIVARDAKVAVEWSERLAYAMIIGIGLTLIWRGWKALPKRRAEAQAHDHHTHSGQKHSHGPEHFHSPEHPHGHHHAHDHHAHAPNADGVCSSCGHAHMPTPDQVEQVSDWRTALGVILSIGMRPCTGAVLVLVFARVAGIMWTGVLAVFAMSIGTAITVSALAVLSVHARRIALRILNSQTNAAAIGGTVLAVLCGGFLIVTGAGLLSTSFDAPVRSLGL